MKHEFCKNAVISKRKWMENLINFNILNFLSTWYIWKLHMQMANQITKVNLKLYEIAISIRMWYIIK